MTTKTDFFNSTLYERFFRGFMATLRSRGESNITTLDDDHQRRFANVVSKYKEHRALKREDLRDLPAFFSKSQITGRYKELDDALLLLQNGLLGAQNPYYPEVKFGCSPVVAKSILERYSSIERELFEELAETYLNEQMATH